MSNLIKSVYFHVNQDGTRVIDSDSQMTQFIPEILQQRDDTGEGGPSDAELEAQELPGDFRAGMHVLNMDDVRQEERERVEMETSEQVQQLLEQARQEADAILQEARQEADSIRNNAYEEGKEQGLLDGQEAAAQKLQEQQNKFQQHVTMRLQELKEQELALEPQFADIMAFLIEKITGVLCQDKKEIIVYLIHQALNQLERTQSVTLRVSKDDVLKVSSRREELKQCLAEGVELNVTEDESLKGNQCIIETDHKMIDCSLDVQLQNVKDQIRMMTVL